MSGIAYQITLMTVDAFSIGLFCAFVIVAAAVLVG
jgi:hypothetical protein